jgi:hypothetical protein
MAAPPLAFKQRLAILAVMAIPLLVLAFWLGGKGFFTSP